LLKKYIIIKLILIEIILFFILKGFLAPGELDPLNRRLITEPKPEGFVQVCVLTDSEIIQSKLASVGVHIQQVKDLELIQVRSVQILQNIYSHLGLRIKINSFFLYILNYFRKE
jgi:phosphorylase kinase alpha/beta subunit